jgi:hypothetical protein
MRKELKQTFGIAAALFVPTTILALSLVNPHGSHGSILLFAIGAFIGFPFYAGLLIAEHSKSLGLIAAIAMQFAWMVIWVKCWKYLYEKRKVRENMRSNTSE